MTNGPFMVHVYDDFPDIPSFSFLYLLVDVCSLTGEDVLTGIGLLLFFVLFLFSHNQPSLLFFIFILFFLFFAGEKV